MTDESKLFESFRRLSDRRVRRHKIIRRRKNKKIKARQPYDVIAVEWFQCERDTIGIVLTKTVDGFRGYIGLGFGTDEDHDAQHIAGLGTRIPAGWIPIIFGDPIIDTIKGVIKT